MSNQAEKISLGSGNIVMIVVGPVFVLDEKAANVWRQTGALPGACPLSPSGATQGDDVA